MISVRILLLALVVIFVRSSSASAQSSSVIPPNKPRAGQWVEKVWGDPDKAGESFVIRIHADAGYIILPHTHLIDENIVVLQGVWSLGMGARLDRSALEQLDVGAFGFAPKNMPHFAWSKTETTIQVHGIGPFSSKLVDEVYELTEKGTFVLTYLLKPGTPTQSAPADCFAWKIGTRLRSDAGEGTVIAARCSPANKLTQYWIRKENGEQFWAPSGQLKATGPSTQVTPANDSDVRPPVTEADLKIVKRARELLNSPSKWNRADDRVCPDAAKTFSLYCALEVATKEITGKPDHRGAALQETRFVVEEITYGRNYEHRLMNYNNDPTTTFEDIQEVLAIVERLITLRLKTEQKN